MPTSTSSVLDFAELIKEIKAAAEKQAQQQDLKEEDIYEGVPAVDPKDSRDIKRSLDVIATPERTYLIVLAVSRNMEYDDITHIGCDHGTPIGYFPYDSVNDTYEMYCTDFMNLGYIPVSFGLGIKGSSDWFIRVPMPESVIKRYMTDQQLMDLKVFRGTYNSDDYDIEFLQLVD